MAVKQVVLPNNWKPREYQRGLWRYLRSGGKRAVCAWHRRAGKDDVCLHHTAIAAHQRVGNYWHMLPEYAQARKAIWEAVNPHTGKKRIDEAFPKELRKFTRENEMIIGFHNGSTWQVVGSDNYDSLMGSTPCGVVMSEFALGNPSAWGYLSPILMENDGWALFISTPRGKNHFHQMMKYGEKREDWFTQRLTADQTGVFSQDQLEEELARLQAEHGDSYGKSLWLQEYFVSFDAAIPGSIFGEWLDKAQQQGRITKIEWEKHLPVDTAWDLGRADATAIWFYQFVHGEIHVIDYHESTLKDMDFYADLIRKKPYRYGMHWLPHDARARTLASGGQSIYQQLYQQRVGGEISIAKRIDLQDQIQSARKTLPRCRFDEVTCEKGLLALRNYHYEWDEDNRKFSDRPNHDWSSHGSSAFMTLSRSWKIPVEKPTESDMMRQILAQNPGSMTFGTAKKRHLNVMRSRRES